MELTKPNVNVDETKMVKKESVTDEDIPLSFVQERHLEPLVGMECVTQMWRLKERMKTVSVALVLCLNVGVDPPDVIKTQPCAKLECWTDPTAMSSSKALEKIGQNLQAQYERWQPRARYKQSLDPTSDDIKKLCTSLRRSAKEERVLFHYNGHGVPKPTSNGEIWVFNRTYTQYIPLSIYDLQTWMGAPSIYVYDCSNAGTIIESFKQFANQHEQENEQSVSQTGRNPQPLVSFKNCIQLAACSANQGLPMNPDLPADLFTSCLTTPIKVALRWFILQPSSKLMPKVGLELLDKIPGQITDRRTLLGELNWIFTAITDTIAWNTLPREEPFQHLPFFEEQLTAFQVWLELGSEERDPPEQLPIVLQVLLSQVHRVRALELLGKFLDLGPWAVNLALSVGIFPYVLKLLQSSAAELRPLLVYIWAKILAVDNVRAAAVYAFGTFINSVTERSEHANNVDHSVVITLVNMITNDMCPMVRKELINALQWMVLAFEPAFINVALKEPSISSNRDSIMTSDLKRMESRDSLERMKRVASSSAINNMSHQGLTQNYCGSPSILPSLGGYNSIYMKIWIALCSLEIDPHPDVARMACTVTGHIRAIVKEHREYADNLLSTMNNSSLSLPPSPNKGNYFSGESPPTLHPTGDLPKYTRSILANRNKKMHKNNMNENNQDKIQFCRKPLVRTKFVEWSSKRFALTNKKEKCVGDIESSIFHERNWRQTRNTNIRLEADEEHRRASAYRIDSQMFQIRTAVPPSLLQLHPFDQQIAVSGNDSFA
nr:regulatory-associated protein of mTOR-like [Leptinotarsa decemlineata]